jgi:hypothetical protein
MKKFVCLFFCGVIIFFVFTLVARAPETNAAWYDFLLAKKDSLIVRGNKIYFNGQETRLRGVAVGDPYSRVLDNKRGWSDYYVIKNEWGANTVRLSVHPGVFRADEEKAKKILEKEIASARSAGLIVIIDWHVIGEPDGWYKSSKYRKKNYYSYDSTFSTARNFWQYMAIKYRNDLGVSFELWNEPASDKSFVWKDLSPYMARLYDIIRANGAKNMVIIPGTWLTYDMRGIKDNPLKGENISYAWHNYPDNVNYLSWDKALDNLQEQYPVIVTEWGFSDDPEEGFYSKIDGYATEFPKYIESKNLNYIAWIWHGSWQPNMFENDWYTLTKFGETVKNMLKGIDSI